MGWERRSLVAAFATLVALARREQTGEGALVEVPLVEGALNLTAEQVVELSAFGEVLGRTGNRSPHCAPQGLYRGAEGDEDWLALSVADDDQWQALCKELGRDDLAAGTRVFGGRLRYDAPFDHATVRSHMLWTRGRMYRPTGGAKAARIITAA